MYLQGLERLDRAGFVQYEISNVAREGFASRHNLKYWRSGDWRGFGCGAHSTVAGRRWQNVAGTSEYVGRVAQGLPIAIEGRTLSSTERIEEAVFTALRLSEGIDRRNFQERFGVDPWSSYGELLGPYVEAGLVWQASNRFGLTREGMLVSSEILSHIV
jgi:oxygen-independent coproporphyrinogen-3 oxidase